MNIERTTGVNFGAHVDKKFIKNTEKYFLKRTLIFQYDTFQKTLNKLETFGEKNTHIIYRAEEVGDGFMHSLYLKNTQLNNKQAIILTRTTKYQELLRFFNNITDYAITEWENYLKQIK